MKNTREALLRSLFETMLAALGPSHWWPGETPLEVAVGAILTQNTNWGNVERAMQTLKTRGLLSLEALSRLSPEELADCLRPAGYFRVKAARLRHFLQFLQDEGANRLEDLEARDLPSLRSALLTVRGIGPETADSILLYALNKPSFVVDAYTRRICHRHGLVPEDIPYEELQAYFQDVLPPDVALFNEFHALIVRTAKQWCRKRAPLCRDCPLHVFLEYEPGDGANR